MKKLLLFLLLVAAALGGIALWINLPRSLSLNEQTFSYAAVEKGKMLETISASGVVNIEPSKVLLIGSEMPGTVVAVLGKVNDRVSEGALLVKLDDRQLQLKQEEAQNGVSTAQAALAQAEASLAQAQALYQAAGLALKYQVEIENKGGFRSERDQAEVKVKAAEAGVAAAKAGVQMARAKRQAGDIAGREVQRLLDLTRITVPVVWRLSLAQNPQAGFLWPPTPDYLIVEAKVQRGQQVGPGTPPLFLLASSLERMEVLAQVAEGDIGRVKKGLQALFTVTAFSDENIEFRGQVKEIHPLPSNVKGAIFYDTAIEVENQKDADTGEWRLRPGMTAAVDILRREHKDIWKIPTAALNFQMEEPYQSSAAQERLAQWKTRPDHQAWKPLWTWDPQKRQPWPIFVRIGGLGRHGEPGLKDAAFNEVLEWEPGLDPAAIPGLRVITNAPPARAPGFLDRPANLKVS